MLSPKLTNCPECTNIPSLIKKIDCKLAELGNSLYNNISYMLNKSISYNDMSNLIVYRRILLYKYMNPNYVSLYSVNKIASKVINIVSGCVSKCPCAEVPLSTTTTSSSSSSTTTSTTTSCPSENLIFNSEFNTNLSGWNQTIGGSWVWSSFNGGSANYTGQDEGSILYQNILTPGVTYDISFDLWMNLPLANPNLFWVKVYVGTTEYGPFKINGHQTIELILTCTDTSMFGIQAYDADMEPHNTIFIDNVHISEHCSGFTTTTTTTIL